MSKILQFVLQIKDQMSSGVLAAATNVNRTFDSMSRRANTVGRSIHDINMQLDSLRRTRELSVDTRQIRNAGREMAALERQRDRLMGMGGAGRSGSGLGLAGLVKGYMGFQALNMAGSALTSSVGNAMERGMLNTQFGVLTGSSKKGDALTKELARLSADTILGPGVFKNAQTMLSFGVATEKIMPVMKMLGNISGGNQEKLDGLALAFANTASAGRLTGQDLLQYVNAGFNPLNEISRKTGVSMAILKKRMEDGGISVDMVHDAMKSATSQGGRFYDMLNKAADTPFGKFQKLKGQLMETSIRFGEMLNPVVSGGLDVLSDTLDKVNANMVNFSKGALQIWNGTILPTFKALKPILVQSYNAIVPILSKITENSMALASKVGPTLTNIANILSKRLVPAIKIAGPILGFVFDKITKQVNELLGLLGTMTGWISKWVDYNPYLKMLDKLGDTIQPKIDHIKEAIKSGISDDEMVKFFKSIGEIHGTSYMNAIAGKLSAIAQWADNFYNTTYFTQRVSDLKSTMKVGKTAIITPGGSGSNSSYSFPDTGLGDSKKKVKEHTDTITGGGARNIYITLGKFQDQLNIHTMTVKEGVNEMEQMIENSLLRILNSANAISN